MTETISKLETGIQGFDLIADGGLPEGRTTLVTGTAGSAKTVFAAQFLAAGIMASDEAGVFVTFEEAPADIRRNLASFGWPVEAWEGEGKWAFVDAAPRAGEDPVFVGDYDLGALLVRIEHAIKKVGAKRVSLDSVGAIFTRFSNIPLIRSELFRIASALKTIAVTSVITSERTEEYGEVARYGVEEFVADNVIILRNALGDEKRRRTLEILKFRGTTHQKGEYPFSVIADQGVVVIPLSALELKQKSSKVRISSGVTELDKMCGGGFYRDSIILVSGPTGTGKTLTVTHFIAGAAETGERSLLFGFEESREQLFRNAASWGFNLEQMERDGLLKVICDYPEVRGLEDHLIKMKADIEAFKPQRVAIDSLSALDRVATVKSFREFVIGLTSFIKHQETAGLFTSTSPTLLGGTSVTDTHISTITDTIILLRYVEMFGEMRRGLTVLKMRGSEHDKGIREFTISSEGMHVGTAFDNLIGILSGNIRRSEGDELERTRNLFKPD